MGSVVAACRISCPAACGILVSQPETEPASPTLQGRFLTTGPSGKSLCRCFCKSYNLMKTERMEEKVTAACEPMESRGKRGCRKPDCESVVERLAGQHDSQQNLQTAQGLGTRGEGSNEAPEPPSLASRFWETAPSFTWYTCRYLERSHVQQGFSELKDTR